MKIPTQFELGGMTWTVKQVPHLSNLGECERDRVEIKLRQNVPRPVKESAFLHELVHAIKFTTGDGGPHDEKEVDAFANLLYQYMVTAR
jgi:hypothetical protein